MERTKVRENPFPSDLEGRLDAILNVVNTEMKSLTLLHLETEHALSGLEIQSKVGRTLQNRGYLVDKQAFQNYCSQSLYPIGMVAIEEILSEGEIILNTGYKITSAGRHYGLPISAFSLDFAVRNNRSMYSILGSTVSKGNSRAPSNRIKILTILAKNGVSEVEICESLSLDAKSVLDHLNKLREAGLVNFSSVGNSPKSKRVVMYEFVAILNEPQTVSRERALTQQVYQELKKRDKVNPTALAEDLNKSRQSVSKVLSGLLRQGHAKFSSWSTDQRSKVSITSKGREFYMQYLVPLMDALSDGPELKRMNADYLLPVMHDSAKFTKLAQQATELYARISPAINRRAPE